MNSVSLINGHIDHPIEFSKLENVFKQVNYRPVNGAACRANLYNQFSETAIDEIITQLLELGVRVSESD